MSSATGGKPSGMVRAMGGSDIDDRDFERVEVAAAHTLDTMRRRRTVRSLTSDVAVPLRTLVAVTSDISAQVAGLPLAVLFLAANVEGLAPGWYRLDGDDSFVPVSAKLEYVTESWPNANGPAIQLVLAMDLRSIGAPEYGALAIRAGRAVMGGWMTGLDAGLQGAILAENSIARWTRLIGAKPFELRPIVSLSMSLPSGREGE
ncbi:hypothetical protein [Actinocatenispora comari]|uniref:Uncharacterized protein n=1 Tax=Actinocatenispora comari TaxID=2807577 RepID=A0A8J4EJL9_9ACTN|nr:hypothetical protein [Actinocatenispora comari]GIL26436.1 hypothetical protein NUM_16900 [Actinocatenispora comari]